MTLTPEDLDAIEARANAVMPTDESMRRDMDAALAMLERRADRRLGDVQQPGRLRQRLNRRHKIVGDDTAIQRNKSALLQQGAKHGAIAVINLAARQRHTRLHQFVAGTEKHDSQLPVNLDPGLTDGRQQTNSGRRQLVALLQHQRAVTDILPLWTNIVVRFWNNVDLHPAISPQLTIFLHDDGVGASGNDCTGKNPGGCAVRQRLRRDACRYTLADGKHAVGGQVQRIDRITIHRRIGLGRHIHTSINIQRQHPAQRIRQRHFFYSRNMTHTSLLQDGQGLINRQQTGNGATVTHY